MKILQNGAVLLHDTLSNMLTYTAPVLQSDRKISFKIRSLNQKQYELFDMVKSWAKKSVKIKLMSDKQLFDLWITFQQAMQAAPTGVPAKNIDGITIHTALNIRIIRFGKHLPLLSDKMRSSLRNNYY